MDIDPENLKALASKLRDRDSMPPREAIYALIALAGEELTDLVTLCPGGRSWLLVAIGNGGLVVVEVDFGSADWWSWDRDRRADDAAVTAQWFPFSAIRSVTTSDLRVWTGGFMESALELRGVTGFAVVIDSREPVMLADDPTGRSGAVIGFVRELQRRLST